MDEESNLGLNKLAQVMQERMRKNQEADGALVLDFGTIQKDMSLKTNTFAIPIPQKDYHVLRQLTLGKTGSILTQTQKTDKSNSGGHSHNSFVLTAAAGGPVSGTIGNASDGKHVHDVLVPEKMRSIAPGDRVLVAWVQSDAVVIDIILPATSV